MPERLLDSLPRRAATFVLAIVVLANLGDWLRATIPNWLRATFVLASPPDILCSTFILVMPPA